MLKFDQYLVTLLYHKMSVCAILIYVIESLIVINLVLFAHVQ